MSGQRNRNGLERARILAAEFGIEQILDLAFDHICGIADQRDAGRGIQAITQHLDVRLVAPDRYQRGAATGAFGLQEAVAADVTQAIAGVGTNILDIRASVDAEGHGRLVITAEIFDLKHLEKIISAVKAVKGVIDVERMTGEPVET